jgi:hypothetical protein
VLHVDDYAAAGRKLLLQAEVRAVTLYSSAGVETLWVNRAMPGELHSRSDTCIPPSLAARCETSTTFEGDNP